MKASAIVPFLALPSICAALHPRDFNKDAAAVRSTNGSPPDLSRLPVFKTKPRIFVLTDILNEPDDSESMVRYLLYSNEFDTKAFCATTSTWLRNGTHPEAIRQIITAYSKVTNNLNKHVHPKSQYPPAEQLLSLVTTGPTVCRGTELGNHGRCY